MIVDILYSPRTWRHSPGNLHVMRPLVLDIDTVIDFAREAERHLQANLAKSATREVKSTWRIHAGEVDESSLATMSAPDKAQLTLYVQATSHDGPEFIEDANVNARFSPTSLAQLNVSIRSDDDGRADALRGELATYLIERGTPRFNWRRLLLLVPTLFILIALTSFIWSLALLTPPAPLHILGWVGMLALAFVAYMLQKTLREQVRKHHIGHRIRDESRTQTAARRADNKRDLRVVIITAVATAAAALVVAWMVWALNIDDNPAVSVPTTAPSSQDT